MMLRILFRSAMVLSMAGFIMPAAVDLAEAGSRYKGGKGKSMSTGTRTRRGFGRRTLYLYIPNSYRNDDNVDEFDDKRRENRFNPQSQAYRGGPKIINVEEVLRNRRAGKYLDE